MGSIVLTGATSGSTTLIPTDGATVTITLPTTAGTIQTSGSGYTANGVAYASSTSTLTTGSALTFDGTNLGVGVTPSAWNTSGTYYKAIQFGTNGSVFGLAGTAGATYASSIIGSNVYYDGTNFKAIISDWSARYQQFQGNHQWYSSTGAVTSGNNITYTQAMTLDNSGNLLIGKTSATSGAQGLDVQLAGTAGNQIGFSSQGNSNGQTIYTNTNTGNWRLTFAFGGTNIGTYGVIQFDNSGNAYKASGAGSWLATSDIRIKTNIAPVTDGLSRILQLKPSTFDYKQPEAHQGKVHEKGFIADEYELVYPNSVIDSELVHDLDKQYTDDDKTLKAMSFNAEFYADLVSSIQEQQTLIQSLTDRLNALESK